VLDAEVRHGVDAVVEPHGMAPEAGSQADAGGGPGLVIYVDFVACAEEEQLVKAVLGPQADVGRVVIGLVELGDEEQARVAKLAINLMIAVSAGMMSEALTLARKGNIEWDAMLELISDSAVGSPMVKYKVPPLSQRDFTSTFPSAQMAKDLDLILDCAHGSGVSTPLAAQMREAYTALIATGHGDVDYIATVHHTERLSGLGEPTPSKHGGQSHA